MSFGTSSIPFNQQGRWITSGEDGSVAPLLRREFTVPSEVARARLHVAGLGLHRTTLNGLPVTDARLESGLTAYDKTVLYSSYEVELRAGPAVVGVELGRGFYALTTPNVWRWEKAPWRSLRKALVHLELLDGDDRVVDVLVSDEQWRWAPGPTRFDSYYEGETFDAGADPLGWDVPGFDGSGWSAVQLTDPPSGRLVPRRHEPVRVVETIETVRWLGGGDRPLVADFGRTIAGWAQISSASLPKGTAVDLRFGEQLNPDGSVSAESDHVHSDRFNVDRLVVGDHPVTWEPRFSYKGFRFVQVDGVDDPAAVTLRGQHAHNDVASVSTFTCSDPVLSWVDAAMRSTVRNNLHHIPTDTPVYEKNGWTGDVQVALEAMLGQYDLSRLLAKWLDDIADSQLESGLIPVIVPSPGWGFDELAPAPEWTTVYPYLLERMVTWYDRPDLADRHLAAVLRYLDHELARIDDDGLTSGVLGDYLSPGNAGTPRHDDLRIAASCYLHRALRLTADLVDRTGWTDGGSSPAERLRAAADALADAVNATFLDVQSGCYRSDREPTYRQASNILPLAMGITPAEHAASVVSSLVRDLHDHDDHHDAGCLGLSELFGVITRYGHADLALTVATQTTPPSWGAWMLDGATTLREMWDQESRSHNHYFMGAMTSWLYSSVAGVRLLRPGWTEFAVDPVARGDLTYASYHYQGPQGRLGAHWQRGDATLDVVVTVPPLSRARVHLPNREPFWVEEGEWRYVSEMFVGAPS